MVKDFETLEAMNVVFDVTGDIFVSTQVEQYGPYIGRSNTVRLDVVNSRIETV